MISNAPRPLGGGTATGGRHRLHPPQVALWFTNLTTLPAVTLTPARPDLVDPAGAAGPEVEAGRLQGGQIGANGLLEPDFPVTAPAANPVFYRTY